jgi:hypothetical protein
MIFKKLYFDNIWKQKLWQVHIPETIVEQIERNGRSYPYLYLIGHLAQGNFHRYGSFHVCTDLTNSELKIN